MSILNNRILIALLILLSTIVKAQPMEEEYGYYIFPINPGVRNTLAGTMGELRSTHFHTGIDIRTGGQQGLGVLSAADGYVSRIKVAGGGYGNTIYVLHPNGMTTVYAHLKSFRKDIEAYVKAAQYKNESFEVNLFPKSSQFIVSKGDTLALSGNSGSSGGPHLHFDLRDENQHLLNPLKYGFDEVIDTRKPIAKSLSFITFDTNSRIDGEFGRKEYNLTPDGSNYILEDTLTAYGNLGLELYAWDRMNGTRFKTGITEIKFTIDDKETFGQFIDSWSFAKSRSFYQHINYESLVTSGKRYHKLYIDNGNGLSFYNSVPAKGHFYVKEGEYYNGKVSMTDSYGNTSYVKFVIEGKKSRNTTISSTFKHPSISVVRSTLVIIGDTSDADAIRLFIGDEITTVKRAYSKANGSPVFLWDLNKSLPFAVGLQDTTIYTKLVSRVPANQEYKVFSKHADILFSKRSLFDTLFFNLEYRIDSATNHEEITIGNPDIPIKRSIKAILKPTNDSLDLEHAAVYQVYNKNNYSFAGGVWKENQIEFSFRNFGVYTILVDSIAPTIKPLIINRERIVFKLDDKLSGIKKIKASVNGSWLLLAKDPKKKMYWAEKKDETASYIGELVLEVTDNANNTKVYTTKIR